MIDSSLDHEVIVASVSISSPKSFEDEAEAWVSSSLLIVLKHVDALDRATWKGD